MTSNYVPIMPVSTTLSSGGGLMAGSSYTTNSTNYPFVTDLPPTLLARVEKAFTDVLTPTERIVLRVRIGLEGPAGAIDVAAVRLIVATTSDERDEIETVALMKLLMQANLRREDLATAVEEEGAATLRAGQTWSPSFTAAQAAASASPYAGGLLYSGARWFSPGRRP